MAMNDKADPDRRASGEVDAYLAALDAPERAALERLRALILRFAPGATERVSYGIPILRVRRDLLGISAKKGRCSLHVMSPPLVKRLEGSLAGMKASGATLHFPPDAPPGEDFVAMLVAARLKELS